MEGLQEKIPQDTLALSPALHAKQHQRLHNHGVMAMINEAFCKNPMAVRITARVLRRPAWKRRGDWSRRPTDRHSVLLGLLPIGPFIACRLAFSWTYRELISIVLCHLGRETPLTVESGMAQFRCCLDPRPGLVLGGSLNGSFGLDGVS